MNLRGRLLSVAYPKLSKKAFKTAGLVFGVLIVATLVPLQSARAQTRVYDLPNGGAVGTYYEVNVLTTFHGNRTTAAPLPMFYPRDPYTTPVYVIDANLGIYIFCGPRGTWSQLQTT